MAAIKTKRMKKDKQRDRFKTDSEADKEIDLKLMQRQTKRHRLKNID